MANLGPTNELAARDDLPTICPRGAISKCRRITKTRYSWRRFAKDYCLPNKTIKPSTITRVGYEYQDLVGIEALIQFYRDPDSYAWIQLEAVENGTSLDDVVIARADGSYDYIQVKFTVDKMDYPLDWTWLTETKGRGTSLLTKWSTSLRKLEGSGVVRSASLRTNRVPDAAIKACLVGDQIDLSKIPAAVLSLLQEHCGGAAECEAFFGQFRFRHSERDFDQYENALRDQLVPSDLEPNGWLFLRERVRTWTTRRNQPPPDGRILHEHLVQAITKQRPQPIRQDFRVTPNYVLPSRQFGEAIVSRLKKGAPITVVWGTPGKGKSTFLSALTNRLRREGAGSPVIRHHYFLALDDATPDRSSFMTIAASLINQLFVLYPDSVGGQIERPTDLRPLLERAARYFAAKGQRLYVIIDGLDHVWRETARVDQLNQLFSYLLPVPDNVSLVVGTQKVSDDQLPRKLIQQAKSKDWVEVPAMDEVAVAKWVAAQDRAKQLLVRTYNGEDRSKAVDAIAESFYKISKGHPLHLIYAFESVALSNRPIRSEDVDAIPSCPDGDIRTYYAALWSGLTPDARETLQAMAGTAFFWPSAGIRKCFGDFSEIAFLVEARESGLVPFHGSIFAWVRERADHKDAYEALLPHIVAWLEADAPALWRWGWLWLTRAQMGDAKPLLDGTTRDWIKGSLASGYSDRQVIEILTAAEWAAFHIGDLAKTVSLRWLKIRALNVRDYQSGDYASFQANAISAAANWEQLRILADDPGGLTEGELVSLLEVAPDGLKAEMCEAFMTELRRRLNVWIELRHKPQDEFVGTTHRLMEVASAGDKDTAERMVSFLKGFRDPMSLLIDFVRDLGRSGNLDVLIWLTSKFRADKWAALIKNIHDQIARTGGYLGVDLGLRHAVSPKTPVSPLLMCWFLLRDRSASRRMTLPPPPMGLGDEDMRVGRAGGLDPSLHTVFFSALASALRAEGDHSMIHPGLDQIKIGWLREGIACLETAAAQIASGALPADFTSVFVAAAKLEPVPFKGNSNEAEHRRYLGFRLALFRIARDLHLVSKGPVAVAPAELAVARASPHWLDELWIEDDIEDQRHILGNSSKALLDDSVAALAGKVTPFNERADAWVRYARFSRAYKLGRQAELMARAADCVMGYGYRKDLNAVEALDAVGEAHRAGITDALPSILRLAPVVERITDFTDGDETGHVRSELIELVANTRPEQLPQFYRHYLEEEEWHYADDCLTSFIGTGDSSAETFAALTKTLVDHRSVSQLGKAGGTSSPAAALWERQVAFLGGAPEDRHGGSSGDSLGPEKPWRVSPTSFTATQFEKLVKEAHHPDSDFRTRKEFLTSWLSHWVAKGRGKKAIDAIEAYVTTGRSTIDFEDIFDAVYEASRAIEGPKSAYKWLVRAQIARNGWQAYWASEDEVMRRLGWAAQYHKADWWQFIVDTSAADRFGRYRGNSFAIGQRYLMRFLVMVGERHMARAVAATLVECFVSEVGDQPIGEITWLS
ncbi:NACHT domain-containing protein [Rhizobium leguminosarum bv. viciae]|nr:NACHT domain-containing protein [Rhizobium leguminosarum bv. viciae]